MQSAGAIVGGLAWCAIVKRLSLHPFKARSDAARGKLMELVCEACEGRPRARHVSHLRRSGFLAGFPGLPACASLRRAYGAGVG
jgi:hypothetical protein